MAHTIPLRRGLSHFTFRVRLEGVDFRVRLDWLTRYGYFNAVVFRDGQAIIAGRGLHPGVDLLAGLRLGVGELKLEGDPATPDNLGVTNSLVHESP